jgi:predicted transcriptional regulator
VKITAGQIRAARALLGISQNELAEQAGVSVPTIKRCETESGTAPNVAEPSRAKIIDALERAGIEFTNGDALGVRLVKAKKTRAVR